MTLLPNADARELVVGSAVVTYYDNRSGLRPVLLVHGTGGTMERHFGRLVPMLAARNRVLGVDLGTPSGDEVEIDDFVAQLKAVIEDAEVDGSELTVVGYSLGAVIVAALAAAHPELVGRLVMINGWMRTDAQQRLRNGVWLGLYEEDSAQLAAFSAFTAYGPRYVVARTAAELEVLVQSTNPDAARAAQMRLNARIDIAAEASRISAPTLIVAGEDDAIVPPKHAYELLGAIADARIAIIPTGHASLTERPAQVYSIIDQFVRETLPTGAGQQYVHPTV